MIAYITTQGAKIEKRGRRLIVKGQDLEQTFFAAHLEQLVLFGHISLTPAALSLIFRERIDTVFLRMDGRYVGRLAMPDPANVMLRKRQFALCDDEDFRVRLSRRIVQGKLLSQATLLARIKRARNAPAAFTAAEKLRTYANEAEHAQTRAELRGIEGRAAAHYFQHLHLGFTRDWHFHKRIRRPPTDPVNCLLSFLYTMLTNRCYAAIRVSGLDPQPGILHDLAYGRDCLPLDLVEEFRALVGDTLTLSLFNLNMLDWDDFQKQEEQETEEAETSDEDLMERVLADPLGAMTPSPSSTASEAEEDGAEPFSLDPSRPKRYPMLLTQTALKRVLTAFSKKMETSFFHPVAQKEMTYSEALIFQARQLRKVLEGATETYEPLLLR